MIKQEKIYSKNTLGIFFYSKHKKFERIEFHLSKNYLSKAGRSTLIATNYPRQRASHGSDLFVLLSFGQFV